MPCWPRSRDVARGKARRLAHPAAIWQYLWLEMDFVDPVGKRKAHSRACLARGGNVQAFITMDYWPEDRRVAAEVWNNMLESLKLGDYLYDDNPH